MSEVELIEIIPEKDPRDVLPTAYEGLAGLSWTTANELDAIAGLLTLVGPKARMLEIGSACGVTAAVLADRCDPQRIVCLDTFTKAERAEDIAIMADSEPNRLEYWRANARPCMRLWIGDLWSLIEHASPASFDVAFVDANHNHPFVLSDLMLAARVLTPSGWLLAHDYRDPNWPDVTEAVDHFCESSRWTIVDIVGSIAFMRSDEWLP